MRRLLTLLAMLSLLGAATPGQFAVARPGAGFAFPRDHGAHPDFHTEWWYVTG